MIVRERIKMSTLLSIIVILALAPVALAVAFSCLMGIFAAIGWCWSKVEWVIKAFAEKVGIRLPSGETMWLVVAFGLIPVIVRLVVEG